MVFHLGQGEHPLREHGLHAGGRVLILPDVRRPRRRLRARPRAGRHGPAAARCAVLVRIDGGHLMALLAHRLDPHMGGGAGSVSALAALKACVT
jgi:hypothetical protein